MRAQVAAGIGFILFLVDMPESETSRFPVWDCEAVDELSTLSGAGKEDGKAAAAAKGGAKRKGAAAKGGGAKKARA